jgi:hypothetical protein
LRDEDETEALGILNDGNQHPAWRLAEVIVHLMGDKVQGGHFRNFFGSALMVGMPNGLSRRRRVPLKGKWVERRSITLTNTVLDFLAHRHLLRSDNGAKTGLSLSKFIRVLKDEYGFYVDESQSNCKRIAIIWNDV